MKAAKIPLPPPIRSLSARLLLLTVGFVMLAEVLIFTPSVGRFRATYLEDRLAAGHLAILALEATPDNMIGADLEAELLSHTQARSIALKKAGDGKKLMLMIDMPGPVDATYDLRDAGFFELIADALATLVETGDRTLRVIGNPPKSPDVMVEMVMDEAPLRHAMMYFGYRIFGLSLVISIITAALVYLALHLMMVRPMRRITENMVAFREDPEDASRVIQPTGRRDEIGVAEQQLEEMQRALRTSLHQKTRLAALGQAVTKINHDLRNILSTAQLVSDRLAASGDPEVRRTTPTLMKAIDRAVNLCAQTLNFTREGPAHLDVSEFGLARLIDDVGTSLPATIDGAADWVNEVPDGFGVQADRDQLYRVFQNLALNALQAGASQVTVSARRAEEGIVIRVADNGPGLSPRAQEHLFMPFTASTRSGGTGLGLAIARELMRAHGGDIALERTDAEGTCFRLSLPLVQGSRRAAE